MMSSYRVPGSSPSDSKSEEFRKYLETGGVLGVITKVLAELYSKEENARPENPLEYFRNRLGAVSADVRELESLKNEVTDLSNELEKVRKENEELKKKLKECQK